MWECEASKNPPNEPNFRFIKEFRKAMNKDIMKATKDFNVMGRWTKRGQCFIHNIDSKSGHTNELK